MKNNPDSLRIAHLSDPHFSRITFHPSQFLSKRWIGNLNLLLFRRNAYQTDHLEHIPELLETLEVEAVCITGDFSSTSLCQEFENARAFIEKFKQPVLFLPGNHDCYTKKAEKTKIFYSHFSSQQLEDSRVEKVFLGKGWWWIGLDCTLATPPLCAYGRFSESMEKQLEKTIAAIPANDNIIIGNHFPLIPSGRPIHDLAGAKRLQEILKRYPQIKLYLHGHDHKPYIIDDHKPLVFNSGSAAHKPDGTFYLFDLYKNECFVERLLFRKERNEFSWVIDWQRHYVY